jgi:hypothetical protein
MHLRAPLPLQHGQLVTPYAVANLCDHVAGHYATAFRSADVVCVSQAAVQGCVEK